MEDSSYNCTLLCFHRAEGSWSPDWQGWGIAQACEKEETCFGIGTSDPAGVSGGTLEDAGQGSGSMRTVRGAVGFIVS